MPGIAWRLLRVSRPLLRLFVNHDTAGEAVLLEGVVGLADSNAILQTLQTKWKSLAVDWTDGAKPSIN